MQYKNLEELVEVIRVLRSENGCPWDREQTHSSLRPNMLEEAYEAVDAIDELSLGGVKFIIAKLQQKGLLKRVGGRKHGEWVVCHDENNTK